jgi:hypothetical protein
LCFEFRAERWRDAPLYYEGVEMTQVQMDHGIQILGLLDQAKAELILLQASGDYVNMSDVKNALNLAIAKVEDVVFPMNDDIEAAVLRNEGEVRK